MHVSREFPASIRSIAPWLALGAILLVLAAFRATLLSVPLERDEGEYACFAQRILQGQVPYLAAYNMKLPGVYYAYAIILAVFGQTDAGIRLGLIVVTSLSTIMVFRLGGKLAGPGAGILSALAFGAFSVSASTLGFTANAEHFLVLFLVAGLWTLRDAFERPHSGKIFLGGLCMGLSLLMKQHAAFFIVFGLGWLLARWGSSAPRRMRTAVRHIASYCAGVATPYLLTALYFSAEGAFDRFWFWTVTYAREYTQQSSLSLGAYQLGESVREIGFRQAPVLLLALAGVVAACRGARGGPWLLALLAASFLATTPGLHFRDHYFLMAAPAIALLAGLGGSHAVALISSQQSRQAIATACLAAGVVGFFALLESPALFASPAEVSKRCYGTNAFPEARLIGQWLEQRTAPGESIAVLGSEPQIYFYASRPPATGYVYTYPLMEIHPYAGKMQREMIREIEAARPRFIVYVSSPHSWLTRPGSVMEIFHWFDRSVMRTYRPVGRVDLLTEDGFTYEARFRWDEKALEKPESPLFFLILERARS